MKLSQRFNEALIYAAELHADQLRKGDEGVPYIAHLLGVASLALDYGAGEDQAIAALLHDAVEDQGGWEQVEIIRQRFGEDVTRMVLDCSDAFEIPKPPWRQRKEAYIAHLAHVSPDSRLVSCADKVQNARTILKDYRCKGEALWTRFRGGREGTLWYYRAVLQAFQTLDSHPLIEELERVVIELETLAAIKGDENGQKDDKA
jgi:(p)ppGpp synthase/HD superfamily hydrolase